MARLDSHLGKPGNVKIVHRKRFKKGGSPQKVWYFKKVSLFRNGKISRKLGKGFLRFSDFKEIVDRNPQVYSIELSNWGEIFLNKELAKIIEYSYLHNIALSVGNGSNMNNPSFRNFGLGLILRPIFVITPKVPSEPINKSLIL